MSGGNGKRYRMCEKKDRYPDEHMARKVANRASKKSGDRLRVYECPICHGYHITKSFR